MTRKDTIINLINNGNGQDPNQIRDLEDNLSAYHTEEGMNIKNIKFISLPYTTVPTRNFNNSFDNLIKEIKRMRKGARKVKIKAISDQYIETMAKKIKNKRLTK